MSSKDKDKLGQVHPTPMGWNDKHTKRNNVDPAALPQLIKAQKRAKATWRPTQKSAPGGAQTLASGFASNTVSSPNSIPELARALKNDVDLIFEHVYNNVETQVSWALKKGGQGALIDCLGNSFEQADAFVKLCREAGYDAEYVFGEIEMLEADVNDWLGTTTFWAAYNLIANAGIAVGANWSWPVGYSVYFNHCWARVDIGGTWYHFDPSIKSYTSKNGIDIADTIGYDSGNFMTDAMDGATETGDYIEDINRTNIRDNLTTLTGNLVDYIKTTNPGATIDDIVGGRSIVAQSGQVRDTAHPYLKVGTTPTIWSTDIDDDYKSTMQVQYDWNGSGFNIDEVFFAADVYGKRMSLFFNGSREAELRVDGTLIATSSAQGIGTWNSVLITASHPAPADWTSGYAWFRVWAEKQYVIANAWGAAGRGMEEVHRAALAQNVFDGGQEDDENVAGEMLTAMFFRAVAEGSMNGDMINRMTLCKTIWNHQIGLVGFYDSPLFDIGLVSQISSPLDNDYARLPHNNTAIAMHGIANEASAIQEMSGVGGVSTTPLVDGAAAGGMKIYDGTSSNWTTDVEPNLTNYDSGLLNDIETWYINNGHRVMIPEDGELTKGSWEGYGFYVLPSQSGAIGLIGGGLKGGTGDDWWLWLLFLLWLLSQQNGQDPDGQKEPKKKEEKSDEPIAMVRGSYLSEMTDISLGSSSEPYGLSFRRQYDSSRRLNSGTLGLGWQHNYDMTAVESGDGLLTLGGRTPAAAAAGIVEMFVCVDLLSDAGKPFDKHLTVALANAWLIEQMVANTVFVRTGDNTDVFVKLPTGDYVSSSGSAWALTKPSTYKLTSPQKVEYNFNADGQLSTIEYPYGMTTTLTYDGGKLDEVTTGLGRTLSFTYTGDLLTEVSDGNGRTVEFAYTDGQLTTVTNADSKDIVYEYGDPGLLTKMYLPEFPTDEVVTNIYDSLGRVMQQKDAFDVTWNYFFAGARSEEVDADGNRKIFYFDRFGNPLRVIDALGNETKKEFDGANRLVKLTRPELNRVEFEYDAMNNLLERRQVAKPGSGLSDIVRSFTYDADWNKVQTAEDALNNVKTFTYDNTTGQLLNIEYPEVDSETPEVSFTYTATGQLETVTDPTDIVTKFTYSMTNEELESVIHDFGMGRKNLTVVFDYDNVGNISSITDANGNETTYAFDDLRRLTNITSPAPFNTLETEFEYDDNNNRTAVKRSTGDVMNPWQIFGATYNKGNQLTALTDPMSHVTSLGYDTLRRLNDIEDAETRTQARSYDELNRLSTVTDPDSNVELTVTYTDNGRVESVTDARTKQTAFEYNGHDRLVKITYADSTFEEFDHDAQGNIVSFTNRAGDDIAFEYDELNRLRVKTPDGQAEVSYEYDVANRLESVSTSVVSGNPASGEFEFFYDSAGRFVREEMPDGKDVEFTLDNNGNVTRVDYPDGYYVEREYDELNRLKSITLNGAMAPAVEFSYDDLSRRTFLTFDNGVVTEYGYRADNRLTSIEHTFDSSSVLFEYGYDNTGKVESQEVDDADFMWHPSGGGTVSYATASDINTYPTVGGTSQSHNNNGCLTDDGTWDFGYDTENHLVTATDGGTSITHRYDPLHRLAQKEYSSTKDRFIYSGFQRIADYDGVGDTLQYRYVYGVGVDEVLLRIASNGTITYLHADMRGSIVATSNAGGVNTAKYKYGPFGETPSLSGITHGFTGQRYDSHTGLYYLKARFLSTKTGRFLQPDPSGVNQGLNLYLYCGNDPLAYADRNGNATAIAFPLPTATPPSAGPAGGPSPAAAPKPLPGPSSSEGGGPPKPGGGGGIGTIPTTVPGGGAVSEPPPVSSGSTILMNNGKGKGKGKDSDGIPLPGKPGGPHGPPTPEGPPEDPNDPAYGDVDNPGDPAYGKKWDTDFQQWLDYLLKDYPAHDKESGYPGGWPGPGDFSSGPGNVG